jgi:hypothetical protein
VPLRHALSLAALLLALLALLAVWVAVDRRPAEWDHANHLERAVACHRILAEPGHHRITEILAMSTFYPPVVPCAAGLLYFALPVTPFTAQLVMWASLVVAVLAVYGTGGRLLGPGVGLVAAWLLATAPFAIFSLLTFQLDLPLAAAVAVTLYAIVRAEAFARPGWTLALGLVLGVGMVVKPPFAAYVAPALAWALLVAWRAPDRARRLRWLGGALALAALVAVPWYGPRLATLPMQVVNRSYKLAALEGHADPLSASGLLFYPRVFQPQFGLLAGLLAVWGLWAVRYRPRARALIWSAALPVALFLVLQNKNLRYTLPLLPAAALSAAAGLTALPRRMRRVVGWACAVLGAVQVSAAAFALPPPPQLPPLLIAAAISHPPSPADWRHAELLDAVERAAGRPARVAVVANDNFFSASNFRYEAARDRRPVTVLRAWDRSPFGVDAALAKTGDQGPDATTARADRIMRAFDGDPWLAAAYPVVATVPLPDGSQGMVRVRRLPPVTDVAPEVLAERLRAAAARLPVEYARNASGVRVELDYEPEALRRGEVREVRLAVDAAEVGELGRGRAALPVRDARVRIGGLLVNAPRLAATGELEVLDAREVAIDRLTVAGPDLEAFLRAQKGLRALRLEIADGVARLRLRTPGPDLSAAVRIAAAAAGPIRLDVDAVRIGAVPVPRALAHWITRHFDPTHRLERLPVPVRVGAVQLRAGALEIGAAEREGATRARAEGG